MRAVWPRGWGPVRHEESGAARIYTRLAPIYDLWAALTEREARKRALAAAGLCQNELVLEVATGTGVFFWS